mgnify:CR=1 FL=1
MPCPLFACQGLKDLDVLLARLAGRDNPDSVTEDRVKEIIAQVAEKGDQALADFTRRFDCPDFTPASLTVPLEEIRAARTQVPEADMDIIAEAARNIRVFHERQKENSWWTTSVDGTILGQMVRPVDSAGLYVPGGKGGETPLISSLLMNAIPAQVAGVARLAMASPPRRDGTINPYILAAADLLGVTEVYRMGSAWAVAALALGTPTVAPVNVVAGPGNIFVATAKRLLSGKVGIDMIAGPSEILVIADDSANPAHLAADMLSQAEHDPLAAAILLTTSAGLAEQTLAALNVQTAALPRDEIARKALADYGAVAVVGSLAEAMDIANRIAPEHLELAVRDPFALLPMVGNAGAVFLGHMSPEPVGDYFAGPNHVLPTMGAARFSSALSVETFCKKTSVIAASKSYIEAHGAKIARLARLEGLEAHARSVESRLDAS